jgi:hypothetical protein
MSGCLGRFCPFIFVGTRLATILEWLTLLAFVFSEVGKMKESLKIVSKKRFRGDFWN